MLGRKRALAGLGDVPLPSAEMRSVSQERSARALVAILPHGCAAAVISSPQSYVDSLPPEEVAEAMVGILSGFGVSSLNAAAAALGSFLSWMMSTHPAATCAFGHHFAQYLRLPGLSPATLTSFKWLRDWCGISSPVYGPVFKAFSRQSSHSSSNDKESLSFRVLLGLEEIAATDASEFVRGHAAAWFLLCMAALRREQSSDCCINSIVVHRTPSAVGTVLVAASSRDKHPNPALACPRPVWAGISGIRHPGAVQSALLRMLGAAPLARCLLPDTDSPSGAPRGASSWMSTPLPASRSDRSLHSLLTHPAIGMPLELALTFHGHSCKRFSQNVCDAAPSLGSEAAHELGRFSKSTAQDPDLVPTEALLQRHALECSVLPDIYAGKSRVSRCFDRVVAFERVLCRALSRVGGDIARLPLVDGWSDVFRDL